MTVKRNLRLLYEFGSVRKRRNLSLNEAKCKLIEIGNKGEENEINFGLNNRRMDDVDA